MLRSCSKSPEPYWPNRGSRIELGGRWKDRTYTPVVDICIGGSVSFFRRADGDSDSELMGDYGSQLDRVKILSSKMYTMCSGSQSDIGPIVYVDWNLQNP